MNETRLDRRKELLRNKQATNRRLAKRSFITFCSAAIIGGSTVLPKFTEEAKADEYGTNDLTSFINTIAPSAALLADANDLYASVMIAQAILETGYGQSALSQAPYYNLFGVKGDGVVLDTLEHLDGSYVTIKDGFAVYDSYYSSMVDYVDVLLYTSFDGENQYYSQVFKRNTSTYVDAVNALTGTYATDPNYGNALISVIQNYGLTAYDTPSYYAPDAYTANAAAASTSQEATYVDLAASANATTGNAYTVQAGDTLWDIAQKYGLSLEQLMAQNNLTDYNIFVGEVLYI
ncbi:MULTISPECIES: glucosaminidase domain-containing protein [unclassified Enterococcus]|uniref:glucosaminidase domain-containing protein n=1 Tax=unclassified Enterococcus TaxID=2608891 RepID=UPI0015525B4D|nr:MULTISPECIES: glucosaminidase domain-containing protein [unclassified Enterococcus]MBS7577325.1 glucosaminidase domain-containing protein [Enterococcus sp. MMGLQ5-2]MBS7584582.1 glucosaminidase domain-containing protein [Enterococcus sp. MMGLQ5-1]NPD12437.1 LysM peptidoglycan-binding domain-containing protein [Enterococcus sp. MMGLQ5-1]NPD37159.1 LysM peptidoglycan-binding domain-containing protein [Enterococcus sp. MMGLQ5-2]